MNIFQNNVDFYPTPKEVVERMLMGEDIAGKTILEPSAGKGDICTVLREYGATNILVCENDDHNRKLLQGKYDEFLCDDFLQLTSERVSHIDYIVMNPPFSKGCEHIHHAYDIAPPGCTIIALCNNSNFSNYYRNSYESKVKELIDNFGHHESLGRCFSTAERKTDVDVALIKLYKEGTGANEFDGYMFESVDSDSLNGNTSEGLVAYNFVRDLVSRYTGAVKLFDETMEATRRINEMAYFDDPADHDKPSYFKANIPIIFKAVKRNEDSRYSDTPVTHALYKKELKRYYWGIIFRKLNMDKYATKELREQINKFIETQGAVPFTMKNIYKVVDMVIQTNGQRMQRALVEVFDKICSLSAQNSTAGEKWKTNSNYMVNKRFIVDFIGHPQDSRWPDKNVRITYGGNIDAISDLVKALCWLTATNYDEIGSLDSHCRKQHLDWGTWFEWGFFRVRVYKKGTAHFEFLDENVWARFNQEVAKTKGWHLGSQEQKVKKSRQKKEEPDLQIPARYAELKARYKDILVLCETDPLDDAGHTEFFFLNEDAEVYCKECKKRVKKNSDGTKYYSFQMYGIVPNVISVLVQNGYRVLMAHRRNNGNILYHGYSEEKKELLWETVDKPTIENPIITVPSDSSEDVVSPDAQVTLSPMVKQFYDLKSKHQDTILLFRCGDFYETYCYDAEKASKILGITLTRSNRTKDIEGKPLSMAGFPYHALDTYLPKLIRSGERVAICDQLEAPKKNQESAENQVVESARQEESKSSGRHR